MGLKWSAFRDNLAWFVAALLALQTASPLTAAPQTPGAAPAPAAQSQAAADDSKPPFRVLVMEGEGAINNIKQPVNRGAVVQVEDENRNPISGAAVTFFLPNEGPSGLFANGSRVLTVFTDQNGLAASWGITFNNQVGLMRMRVVASVFSQTSAAVVTQTNISSGAAVRSSYVPASGSTKPSRNGPRFTKKTFILIAIAGAAAGAGLYFATRKSTPNATIGGGGGVGIGTPTVGAPTVGGPR